jgi:hypothetical protein
MSKHGGTGGREASPREDGRSHCWSLAHWPGSSPAGRGELGSTQTTHSAAAAVLAQSVIVGARAAALVPGA